MLKNIFTGIFTKDSIFVPTALLLLWASAVWAGTGGTEFTDLYTTIQGWSQGYLGKTIAIGAFIVGMGIGIAQQSIMAIALGIGSAMAVQYAPNIIDSMVTALI
ncbi:MAG: TraA family conjugative transfer protein [Syntrophales bacterium]